MNGFIVGFELGMRIAFYCAAISAAGKYFWGYWYDKDNGGIPRELRNS